MAGYQKLHPDPSLPCKNVVKDNCPYLSLKTIAERTAILCQAAESAAADNLKKERRLIYVVGADVPMPGGITAEKMKYVFHLPQMSIKPSAPYSAHLLKKGLKMHGIYVLQLLRETGAAFGPEIIYDYDARKTRHLTKFIESQNNLVFEAYSTDFQTQQALAGIVRDHFAILKVGPCLTFAAREALFALADIEQKWLKGRKDKTLSQLADVMHELMQKDQSHWESHYSGSDAYLKYITIFRFSDRIRYYWSHHKAVDAVKLLFDNLTRNTIP